MEDPPAVEIPGCGGKKCTIDEIYEGYKELIPGEFDVECGVKQPEITTTTVPPPVTTTEKNSAPLDGNGRILSFAICSFWFIRKLFS